MKYSVKGNLQLGKSTAVVSLINTFTLWRLVTDTVINRATEEETFIFEAWVNTENDKNNLFNALKTHVNRSNEDISWHECTHDEPFPLPCKIVEVYRGE